MNQLVPTIFLHNKTYHSEKVLFQMAIGKSHWFQQKLPYTIKPNSKFLKRNSQDCLSAFSSSPISFGLRWSPCPLVLRNYSLYSANVVLSEKERPTIQREKIPSNSPKKFQVRTLLCMSYSDNQKQTQPPDFSQTFTQLFTICMEVVTLLSWLNLILF